MYNYKILIMRNLFLLTILVLAILTSSCFRRAKEERDEKRAEKMMEKIMEKAGAEDADVDIDNQKFSVTTDEGTLTMEASEEAWPNDIPRDVPKFDYGKSGGVMKQAMPRANSWIMNFEDVPANTFEKYKAKLTKEGYECSITEVADMKIITAEKGDNIVTMQLMPEGCVLSVVQEKEK